MLERDKCWNDAKHQLGINKNIFQLNLAHKLASILLFLGLANDGNKNGNNDHYDYVTVAW